MNGPLLPFYWALGAVTGVVATVAGLYVLRPPPRRLLIASALIWERVLRHSHHRSDRLRWWLSLLLAASIAAGMAAAVLRPAPTASGGKHPGLVLILDNSPTMATRTTDGASRWLHAVERARSVLQSSGAGTDVLLADTMHRISSPAFESRDEALTRLGALAVSYGRTPQVPPVTEANGAEMVVITDGVQLSGLPANARIESVFEPVENVGIVAFELRPLPADPRRYEAFVEVANAGGVEKSVSVGLAGTGGRRAARNVAIPQGGTRTVLFDLSQFDAGPVRASVAMPGDGFAADDNAYALLPMNRQIRVTLVSNGNRYLENSLRAQPRVRLSVIEPASYADRADVEAWVFDRFAPGAPPLAPALLFRPGAAGWLPEPGREVVNVSAETWEAGHPLLANLALSDLTVERAVPLAGGGQSRLLVRTKKGAGLVAASRDGTGWVALGFALEDSNFPLHAGFPIFLDNVLNWMVAEHVAQFAGLGTLEVPVPDARIIAADGSELPARPIPGGTLVELAEPGLLTAVSARERLRVTANLLDPRITFVNRTALAPANPRPIDDRKASFSGRGDIWSWVLLAAVLALAFEWWSWNRRLTV